MVRTHIWLFLTCGHFDSTVLEWRKYSKAVSIAVNKNTCPGDLSALKPSGIRLGRVDHVYDYETCDSSRLGTPALTTRGFREKDMIEVAKYLDQAIQLAGQINQSAGEKKSSQITLKDFKENMKRDEHAKAMRDLQHSIESFAETYPMPGFDEI